MTKQQETKAKTTKEKPKKDYSGLNKKPEPLHPKKEDKPKDKKKQTTYLKKATKNKNKGKTPLFNLKDLTVNSIIETDFVTFGHIRNEKLVGKILNIYENSVLIEIQKSKISKSDLLLINKRAVISKWGILKVLKKAPKTIKKEEEKATNW